MKLLRVATGILLLAGIIAACSDTADLLGPCPPDYACVNGTARYYNLEGGFWAIRGDDSVTYDPMDGLPQAFQQQGLRVHLRAKVRNDLGSFHMVGPIVEIVSLTRIDP